MISLKKILSEAPSRKEMDKLFAALGGRDAANLTSKFDDILEKLDDSIGDNKMYLDRKEYSKFQDLIFQLTATYDPNKPDAKQIQNAIDLVVKFYKDTVNKKTKELLDKLESEASKIKSKIA